MQADLSIHLTAAIGRLHQASSDFDLNPEVTLAKNRVLRLAAVLIAVQETAAGPQVILTQRASTLKHHAGQIAFPGGKRDEDDTSLEETALREADEEIGLAPDNVHILGRLPTHETVTGFTVTPILGLVRATYLPKLDHGEVAEAFTAPLSHVTDIARFSIQGRRWRGQRRRYYTVPYGPYYIWGATARILRSLAEGINA
ncbi:MAG: CoA pyrophosphatase [Marinosulfonomonas sp.]|nr:MAG: CoA pyrophosphatase [Marinosulfonomonas sp.]